jgi:HupE / UreJ protein
MKLLVTMVCLLVTSTCYAHGMSDAAKQAMLDGGYLQYMGLGATHMLTGYDHLLFLFGVVFFLTTARDVFKLVSAFTLGHSITLIAATFAGITANYFLIDAVIALSVCYKGFDNNDGFRRYLDVRAPGIFGMVFAFGLIHGFGLSTRLQEMPLGEKGAGMLGRIVAFNVGVELGQVAALLVMMIILVSWRRRPGFFRFSKVANDGLLLAGFLLFLLQMHGYVHTRHPEDFGFNTDAHEHAHEGEPDEAPSHDQL